MPKLEIHMRHFGWFSNNVRRPKIHVNLISVFVRGEFDEGDVVCTTWTMVIIAVGCVIFLVISILVVCVLCIYSNRRRFKASSRSDFDHVPSSSRHSVATPSMGRAASPGSIYHHQPQLSQRSFNTADYSRGSEQAWKSMRTTLRDWKIPPQRPKFIPKYQN